MSYAALYKGTTPIIRLAAGSESGTPWVRNPAWLTLPVLGVSDQRMVGLLAITNDDSNYIALSCAGDYTVDWGDGVTENFASGAVAQHFYTYSAISASTEYSIATGVVARQVVVSVTPQAGSNLTQVDFQKKHTRTNLQLYNSNWLDIAVNSPNMTSLILGHATTNVTNLVWVEKVNVGVVGSVTSFNFRNFSRLESVIISNTINFTSTASMFNGCSSLVSVPLFNTASVTTMSNMFNTCRCLQSVPLFNTAAVNTMFNMFNGCSSLQSVPLFNTAAVTSMINMFLSCSSLQSVPLFNTAIITSMNSMFNGCSSLQSVPLFNTAIVTSMSQMFLRCPSLQSVPLFNTAAVNTMFNMFNGCSSLQSVPLFNTAIVTSMSQMFLGCSSLQSVPLFNTASVTSMSNMFSGCISLKAIPLFNTAAITTVGNISSMFSGCASLCQGRTNGIRFAIDYSFCKLSTAALNDIFTGLGTASGAQTITITSNPGAATCTRSIATAKGWTVSG